ncbi:hypothetical protein Q9L58_003122 [Maublancomyces gigas]|uniref:Uncharacterized protein n=1 Tax=Discina gigas TaxID=1032678 RepID=A0ABR3GQ11_9PEZI
MSFISRRNDSDSHHDSNSTINKLLITLIVLVSFTFVLGGSLILLRRIRQQRKEAGTLPTYESANSRNGRGLRISTRDSAFIYSEKQQLLDASSPMPLSPDNVPEIRITFPEEEDKETGRRISRVMIVQVGEAGVGFVRPLKEESLPPYQPDERFASVDLERIGGLKEKDTSRFV